MTTSLSITVNSTRADLNDYVRDTTDPRNEMIALSSLFSKIASGAIDGSVIVDKAATAYAKATGTITLDFAKTIATDTVTIGGNTITLITGTPSGATESKIETSSTKTASNLVTAINANTTMNPYLVATSALGVVTLTMFQPGLVGNFITLAKNSTTAAAIAVSAATLTGGLGGFSSAGTTYSRGL